mmetsp:Transcript_12460/g.25278  ORF Transcript_12460/g.25278 Transcript_12460/m.25278 type:complete len:249 (+) Transcript_12460:120-866(+)
MRGFKAGDAAQAWVPMADVLLVVGGIVSAISLNRAMGNSIQCCHPSLPLISVVCENPTERLVALCAVLAAVPFNMVFAVGVWAVWRKLDKVTGTACSDCAGPCACFVGGWVLLGLVALNDRELDPEHLLHNCMVIWFVLCEVVFLACSLRSLHCRLKQSACPQCLVSAKTKILAFRWTVVAVGFVSTAAFCALLLVAMWSGSCAGYRHASLYAAFAEYVAVFCVVAQYVEHAFEFHLLRGSGIWARTC